MPSMQPHAMLLHDADACGVVEPICQEITLIRSFLHWTGQHVPRGLAALAFHLTLIASSMNRSVSVFRRSLQSLMRRKLMNLVSLRDVLDKKRPNLFFDCVEDSSLGLSSL